MKTGQTVPTGQRRQWVDIEVPVGPPVADGDGGYTQPTESRGSWAVRIQPATQRELERVGTGTTITGATHLVTGRYHPDVTMTSQLKFRGRTFQVTGVVSPDELQVETIAVCAEVV